MLLVKCNCGSFYTIKSRKGLEKDKKKCPNCDKLHDFTESLSIRNLVPPESERSIYQIFVIPDNAKVKIDFEATDYTLPSPEL